MNKKQKNKKGIKFYTDAKVTCACGHTFTTGSTQPQINVDICAACHPYFTGKMRFVDTQGRVEKFLSKQKTAQEKKFIKKKDRRRQKLKKEEKKSRQQKTLKEMLKGKKSQ